jgi:hypothetical protein
MVNGGFLPQNERRAGETGRSIRGKVEEEVRQVDCDVVAEIGLKSWISNNATKR